MPKPRRCSPPTFRFADRAGPVLVIGLTGGMGMGKSTIAAAFRRAGLPVFDADQEVHRLQARRGAAVPAIAAAFPGTVRQGAVDRPSLRARVIGDEAAMRRLEAILHPLVRQAERRFVQRARRAGCRAVVLDIPLLFETGAADRVDRIVTASAPSAVQRQRVRARRRLGPAQAMALIARQCPDATRRRRSDWVVRTGLSRHHALRTVARLLQQLRTTP